MKSLNYILLLCITGCILPGVMGQAAVNPVQTRPNQQLESQFQATSLSTAQFHAFEKRAIEKLADFGDYLEIVGNNTYEKSLREHAAELTYALFVSSKTQIGAMGPLNKLVESHLNGKNPGQKVYVEEVSLSQPLRLHENQFSGELTFLLSSGESRVPHTAEFTLRQTSKKFGNQTSLVWEVFLGEIKIPNKE